MQVQEIQNQPYIYKKIFENGKSVKQKVPVSLQELQCALMSEIMDIAIKADNEIAGIVSLRDIKKGVWVEYIANYNPGKYSGIGNIADQLEVEYCLEKGLYKFEILSDSTSDAAFYNYRRGKRFLGIIDSRAIKNLIERFETFDINKIMERAKDVNPFENFRLGCNIPTFMPQDVITKYKEIIKKSPLLKYVH